MGRRLRAPVIWLLALAALCVEPAGAAENELIAVRVPLGTSTEKCSGCQLVRIGSGGVSKVLTGDFAAAKDPSVAFDGKTILFAGRQGSTDPWQIWRIENDGSDPTRVISMDGNATAPLHVGALFHLDDERPSDRFVFLSDAHGWVDPTTGIPTTALYAADPEGENLRRISFNLSRDLPPDVLDNGRLVFPTRSSDGRSPVLAVNSDGTDAMAYADAHLGPGNVNTLAVGNDQVFFVAADEPGPLGGGDLYFVSRRRPLRTLGLVATQTPGWHHSPRPLANGQLLVSFLEENSDDGYRLVTLDQETGQISGPAIGSGGYHLVDVHELTPRPQVQGRSSVVNHSVETGVFFCISTHISDRESVSDASRSATHLRVIEGIPSMAGAISEAHSSHRALGEVPVEADGSFHIEVPASTPLAFQLLDAEGRVVAQQKDWVWVMPNERRGCIGCHEDREMAPPNVLGDAIVKPANRLTRTAPVAAPDSGGVE